MKDVMMMIKVDEKVNEKSGNKRRKLIALESQCEGERRKSNQWENLLIQRLLFQRGMNIKKYILQHNHFKSLSHKKFQLRFFLRKKSFFSNLWAQLVHKTNVFQTYFLLISLPFLLQHPMERKFLQEKTFMNIQITKLVIPLKCA